MKERFLCLIFFILALLLMSCQNPRAIDQDENTINAELKAEEQPWEHWSDVILESKNGVFGCEFNCTVKTFKDRFLQKNRDEYGEETIKMAEKYSYYSISSGSLYYDYTLEGLERVAVEYKTKGGKNKVRAYLHKFTLEKDPASLGLFVDSETNNIVRLVYSINVNAIKLLNDSAKEHYCIELPRWFFSCLGLESSHYYEKYYDESFETSEVGFDNGFVYYWDNYKDTSIVRFNFFTCTREIYDKVLEGYDPFIQNDVNSQDNPEGRLVGDDYTKGIDGNLGDPLQQSDTNLGINSKSNWQSEDQREQSPFPSQYSRENDFSTRESTGQDNSTKPIWQYNINQGKATITKYNGTEREVFIPSELDGHFVTAIGAYAFSNHSGIIAITIPNSITTIERYAFDGCTNLKKVTLSDSVKSIKEGAFESCNVKSLIIEEGSTTFRGNMIISKDTVEEIVLPKSLVSIEDNSISRYSALLTITVTSGNPVYHSEGNCLIKTASKLLVKGSNNAWIPSDGSVQYIGNYAFSGCSKMTSITIPEGITAIGNNAFCSCSKLQEISIPKSLSDIGYDVFLGDPLKTVHFGGSAENWKSFKNHNTSDLYTWYSNSELDRATVTYAN